jgi:hypothetical protein
MLRGDAPVSEHITQEAARAMFFVAFSQQA